MERNQRSFEDIEKSLVQLQALCQKTLFDWSRTLGVGATQIVLLSLSFFLLLVLHLKVFFPSCCLLLFLVFTIMNILYLLSSFFHLD